MDRITANGPGDGQLDRILAIVREVLSAPGVTAEDDLVHHGATSLALVRIVALTSRTLDLEIDPRDLQGAVTAHELARVAQRSHS